MKTKVEKIEKIESVQVENAKAEAQRLAQEAKEAAKAAKEAAKAAKEAAAKAKAFSSRPVRTSYFIAYYEDNQESYISKSDVHYCVEKAAIDEVVRQRDNNEELRPVCIFKLRKDNSENEQLISRIYIDNETKQVVID